MRWHALGWRNVWGQNTASRPLRHRSHSMTHPLQLLLVLALIVAAAKLSGAAANRIGQPAVLGEILAGLVLGPTVLDVLGWPMFAHAPQPVHGQPPGPL